jgi:hypothetical protein
VPGDLTPADEPAPAPVARGEATEWTDADLDRMAEVTPEDIRDARTAFHRDAPAESRGLIDAEEER